MNGPFDAQDDDDDGNTELSEEEREGLIPAYITRRGELNEAEQANIVEADSWAFRRKRDVLGVGFLNRLHKRMLGGVWRWAGKYRTTGKNIGVEPWRIGMDLAALCDEARYWCADGVYPPDEIAARFHHRLVLNHPYPNGNGRHARLAADLLVTALGQERFTWGRVNLVEPSKTRDEYLAALRAADDHNIEPLLAFVRS
ncbi:MAG: mobile mystery protein B [Verrucomicrobiales bacterium]|nr:mobile mystery protein B [Verrucomicrobiales bacterium]